jgi:hypothetical protein
MMLRQQGTKRLNDELYSPHLKALEEIERGGIPGLVKVLREEGVDAVRYVLWDATGWHRDYSPPAWRHCTALHEAHRGQVEETMETPLKRGRRGSARATWVGTRRR